MAQQCCHPVITVKCANRGKIFLGIHTTFFVQARNSDGQVLFEGYTGKDGSVRFPAECDLEYRISVYAPSDFSPRAAHRWLRLSQGCGRYLCFMFCQEPPCCSLCRTISLTDRHYAGLPILKGAIFLWRVPM